MNIKINDTSDNGTVEVQVIPPLDEIFHENNTHWEWDGDGRRHCLVYEGYIEELADETHYTEDELIQALGEYEAESLDALETEQQIARDYRTSQWGDY